MLSTILGSTLLGMDSHTVGVEVDVTSGLPRAPDDPSRLRGRSREARGDYPVITMGCFAFRS